MKNIKYRLKNWQKSRPTVRKMNGTGSRATVRKVNGTASRPTVRKMTGTGSKDLPGWEHRRGSFTVEAAFLMPIIITILILMIYFSFYIYNRGVIYGDVYIAALRACEDTDADNQTTWLRAYTELETLQRNQTLALTEKDSEIRVSYSEVAIDYTGSVDTLYDSGVNLFTELQGLQIAEQVRVSRHKPVTFIRQCRKIQLNETKTEG